jgi:hypothetical protein
MLFSDSYLPKPFLFLGPEAQCYNEALRVSQVNNWHFISLDAKDFPSREKDFYTASLDSQPCLFYLVNASALSYDESKSFIELVSDSPHKFILSSDANVNWFLKKASLVKPLGNVHDALSAYLHILMVEKDRDATRLALRDADALHLFHILKFGAWRDNEILDAMLRINRYIYLVKRDYILDMLVLSLPTKAFASFAPKQKENEFQKSIKAKLKQALPGYTSSEIADALLLMKFCKSPVLVELSEEEQSYLGIAKPTEEEPAQVFLQTANLSDFL